MLSITNPPSDPPCPHQIQAPQLKSSSHCNERASGSDKVALQEEEVVEADLPKSGLDDNNPPPKFSIRDYVSGARSKDIQTNWPFAQKNLQLCLKHGVGDLLPPFQPLDSVRNRSVKRCTVETSLIRKENIRNVEREPFGPSNYCVSPSSGDAGCNRKLAVNCLNTGQTSSEEEHELPLTTNNRSNSVVDSVPADRNTSVVVETNNILEVSAEKFEPTVSPPSQKSDSSNQLQIKKSRLILKVGSGIDPTSNEDTLANCVAFSDTMASKVCPVCKTFSSSSNTTLNAHIDQCLSVESTVKWTANSRVIKHRIKPRKTRLMVDIYATALHCTLEELDRRNGTSWAVNSSLPTQQALENVEEEKQRVLKDNGEDGAVYIDANGTKLRILSKFNDRSIPNLEVGPGLKKTFRRGRGKQLLTTCKRKDRAQKNQKYLKLDAQSIKNCSLNCQPSSEVCEEEERNLALKDSFRKEESLAQTFKDLQVIKPNESGNIANWTSSKRTGLLKRRKCKEGLQHLGLNFRRELTVESAHSSLCDLDMERSCIQKTPNSYDSPLSSPGSSKGMEDSSSGEPINEYTEHPPMQKQVSVSSFTTHIGGNLERLRNVKQLRKDGTIVDGNEGFVSYRENCVPSPGKGPFKLIAGPVKSSSCAARSNTSLGHQVLLSKSTKFSSLNRHMMSINESSRTEFNHKVNRKFSVKKKLPSCKKSGVCCMEKLGKKFVTLPSESIGKHVYKEKHRGNKSRREEICHKISLDQCNVLKIKKKRTSVRISQNEQSMVLKSASGCHSLEVGNDIDYSARVCGDLAGKLDDTGSGRKGIDSHGYSRVVVEPSSGVDIGGNAMRSGKSLDSEFQKLSSPCNMLADSLHSAVFKSSLSGAETQSCPSDPSLSDEPEMFHVNKVGSGTLAQSTGAWKEIDSMDGQGNYFNEVDPISIPGPPGSYLPSPRDMGSEDLQGSASLTTSRVQSSEDQYDLVDRDLSDSPISAMSTISHSPTGRPDDLKSPGESGELHVAPGEIRLGSSGDSHGALTQIAASIPLGKTIQEERTNLEELKVGMIGSEKGPINFRNDQPCCCSRKEGMSQEFSLNYQDSQVLWRQTMDSVPVPAMGKPMSCYPPRKPNGLYSLPEAISLGNFPGSGPEKLALPVTKMDMGPVSIKVFADSDFKSPVYGECDSASPSSSNPVLRLMGKDVMVVSKDENVSQQYRKANSSILNGHLNQQSQMLSGVSLGNTQKENSRFFHHMVHQHPLTGKDQSNTGFNIKLSNSFRSNVNCCTPQTTSRVSAAAVLNRNMNSGFRPALESHEDGVWYGLPNDQNRSRNRPYFPLAYNVARVATASDTLHEDKDLKANPEKEIIVIEDGPEREAEAPYSGSSVREGRVAAPGGMSIPVVSSYNSRHGSNHFYGYQPQVSLPYSGQHKVQSGSFQMPPQSSASPVTWNCS
ncbi:uncharacterized protein LOC127792067 [Diospyros lotus]|uniref:uncharacterized protein LOC127792067 n=1 Tax=Diospyros lotus TaxID=55363 RepID=UPI00224DFB3B|nr:uncharacterized protein LOC127792067 [Diospyros lotus]XP_052178352.1 uncharacterized protein LOC127792067 [Diospyros lotus]XP_052178353.1 uncharacterized protein LOC127792067 [Diospyros lotus]XP_052178354.1 uncharacterized protein LOC127792067 [Diospyros lotus]